MKCQIDVVPNGVRVSIVSDGFAMISRVFADGADALAWAEEEREASERGE